MGGAFSACVITFWYGTHAVAGVLKMIYWQDYKGGGGGGGVRQAEMLFRLDCKSVREEGRKRWV